MLEVRELDVAYGEVPALRQVSMIVAEGESVSVLGANGAGKSTLLRAISGLLRPRHGAITLDLLFQEGAGCVLTGFGIDACERLVAARPDIELLSARQRLLTEEE